MINVLRVFVNYFGSQQSDRCYNVIYIAFLTRRLMDNYSLLSVECCYVDCWTTQGFRNILNLFLPACVWYVDFLSCRRAPRVCSDARHHPPRCHSILGLQLSVSSWKRQLRKSLYFLSTVHECVIHAIQPWILFMYNLCVQLQDRIWF